MSESNYPDCPDFLVLPRLVHPSEGFKKGNQSQWRLVVKPAKKNRIAGFSKSSIGNLTQIIQILQQILQPVRLVTFVFRTPITAGRNDENRMLLKTAGEYWRSSMLVWVHHSYHSSSNKFISAANPQGHGMKNFCWHDEKTTHGGPGQFSLVSSK